MNLLVGKYKNSPAGSIIDHVTNIVASLPPFSAFLSIEFTTSVVVSLALSAPPSFLQSVVTNNNSQAVLPMFLKTITFAS